jgi:hypothetical protein
MARLRRCEHIEALSFFHRYLSILHTSESDVYGLMSTTNNALSAVDILFKSMLSAEGSRSLTCKSNFALSLQVY